MKHAHFSVLVERSVRVSKGFAELIGRDGVPSVDEMDDLGLFVEWLVVCVVPNEAGGRVPNT